MPDEIYNSRNYITLLDNYNLASVDDRSTIVEITLPY